MNKRIRKKSGTRKCHRVLKALKKVIPGIKLSSIFSSGDGYFSMEMEYQDIILRYDSLYTPNKLLIEFKDLVDKWRDWRVYHDIEVGKDLSIVSKEVKYCLDSIYDNYTSHYVNSLTRRHYVDIDNLEKYLDMSPEEYYDKHKKEKKDYRLESLKIHQENIAHIKSCCDKVLLVNLHKDEYTVIFKEQMSWDEFNAFYKKACKIRGHLNHSYMYLN